MKVYVTYSDGRPVKNARVEIRWKSGGSSKGQTDQEGCAKFGGNGGIASGIYVADKHVRGTVKLDHNSILSVEYN